MTDVHSGVHQGRSSRLDQVLATLLSTAPELEAAAVVSFDGLPMASALPPAMDEDRVAAMSAALLSLGDRAAQGLGRGDLSQVYVEGEHGTVFLVSADEEAVLVAVAARHAKIGLMLFEVRRAAKAVADALVADDREEGYDPYAHLTQAIADLPTVPDASYQPEAVHAEASNTDIQREYVAAQEQLAAHEHATHGNADSQSGGPVMVPTGGGTDEVAPDGLAWPQFPPTDPGWS